MSINLLHLSITNLYCIISTCLILYTSVIHVICVITQVTVVMPVVAPIMKISQCQEMGANVIVHGATIAEVRQHLVFVLFLR